MRNNKILAIIAMSAMLFTTANNAFAVSIGNITVKDVDSTVTPTITQIDWNGNYPIGELKGTVEGVVVKAKVEPVLNMSITSDVLDFGTLSGSTEIKKDLEIEVGTNASNGVVITVQSKNGGLLNKDTTNGAIIPYNYSSTNQNTGSDIDSTIEGFNVTETLATTKVTTDAKTIYKTNKPEKNDDTKKDLKFEVALTPSLETPSGEYEDLLTFTITGNF